MINKVQFVLRSLFLVSCFVMMLSGCGPNSKVVFYDSGHAKTTTEEDTSAFYPGEDKSGRLQSPTLEIVSEPTIVDTGNRNSYLVVPGSKREKLRSRSSFVVPGSPAESLPSRSEFRLETGEVVDISSSGEVIFLD